MLYGVEVWNVNKRIQLTQTICTKNWKRQGTNYRFQRETMRMKKDITDEIQKILFTWFRYINKMTEKRHRPTTRKEKKRTKYNWQDNIEKTIKQGI